MNDNGKNASDLTPEERIVFLESLLDSDEPWIDHGAIFLQFLDDQDPEVRITALRGLWYSPDPSLIDQLIEMANQDPSPKVRAEAVSALGIYVYQGELADYGFDWGPMTEILREDELPEADFVRVKDFLLRVFAEKDRPLDERRFAIEALGFLSDPEVTDLVEEAYNRPEREMKTSALFAMGRSGLVYWTDILARELYNAEHDIQLEAIRAVGEIGLTELGEDLWRLTYAEDREIMLEAIEALGQSGWEEAFDRLDELTLHSDPEIAQVAKEALDEWLLMSEIAREAEELDLDESWDDETDPDLDLGWDEEE
jgi:HEAT repeat protein